MLIVSLSYKELGQAPVISIEWQRISVKLGKIAKPSEKQPETVNSGATAFF